jgi:hypothetical protein
VEGVEVINLLLPFRLAQLIRVAPQISLFIDARRIEILDESSATPELTLRGFCATQFRDAEWLQS